MIKRSIIILMIINLGAYLKAQHSTKLDSYEYTTALVEMVEQNLTACHMETRFFTFKILKHISGPQIENNTLILSQNLRGYSDGDATKIFEELYGCDWQSPEEASKPKNLVINFIYNPTPKFSISDYVRGCKDDTDVLDYGISFIRWAVAKERKNDIEELDKLLESSYNRKFYLLGERQGKFFFMDGNKQMVVVQAVNGWVIAEVKND